MRVLTVSDVEEIVPALQSEIRRSADARYDHRLHAVLLVAQGMTCPEVGLLLGDAPRTVEYWVHRFERDGFVGLRERPRSGRPRRLTEEQREEIFQILHGSPADVGMGTHLWDGKTLSAFIEQHYGEKLGVRQCQRLFRGLGVRLRKPRPQIAHADHEVQAAYKKTQPPGEKSSH
jgi:transposase